MFDVNMRHLPKGHKAVGAVWGCKEGTVLYNHGVRKGDYIKFTMLDEDSDNPEIVVHLTSGDICVDSDSEGLFAYHILYWCTIDDDGTYNDFSYETDKVEMLKYFEEV